MSGIFNWDYELVGITNEIIIYKNNNKVVFRYDGAYRFELSFDEIATLNNIIKMTKKKRRKFVEEQHIQELLKGEKMEKIKLSRSDKGFLYALLIANKEKSADELFNEQEFYLDIENEGIMIYSNYFDTEIWFLKEKKEIELGGRNPKLTPKLVLTINKKCAELQWYENLERRRI